MRQFVSERTEQDTSVFKAKNCRQSAENWIEMLEGLVNAAKAYLRIEKDLLSRAESRPHSYCRAPTLFAILRDLPKVARPNWEDPSSTARDIGVADSHAIFLQVQHSFVYTSRGLVMLPDEVVQFIAHELGNLSGMHNRFTLTPTQKGRVSGF